MHARCCTEFSNTCILPRKLNATNDASHIKNYWWGFRVHDTCFVSKYIIPGKTQLVLTNLALDLQLLGNDLDLSFPFSSMVYCFCKDKFLMSRF